MKPVCLFTRQRSLLIWWHFLQSVPSCLCLYLHLSVYRTAAVGKAGLPSQSSSWTEEGAEAERRPDELNPTLFLLGLRLTDVRRVRRASLTQRERKMETVNLSASDLISLKRYCILCLNCLTSTWIFLKGLPLSPLKPIFPQWNGGMGGRERGPALALRQCVYAMSFRTSRRMGLMLDKTILYLLSCWDIQLQSSKPNFAPMTHWSKRPETP